MQATKGVSDLYDTIESFFETVKGYVERIGIHLQASTPPTPSVMRILLDTLVQVLDFLAIVTKYCNRAVERNSWMRKAKTVVPLRISKFLALDSETRPDYSHRGLLSGNDRQGRCRRCVQEA